MRSEFAICRAFSTKARRYVNKLLKFSESTYANFAYLGGGILPFSAGVGAPMLQRTGRIDRRPTGLGQKFLKWRVP